MKPEELRIGNHVQSPLGDHVVLEVMCDCINTLKHEGLPIGEIDPIPLTKEWLSRFGFEKLKGKKNESYFGNADLNFGNPVLKINDYTNLCTNGGNEYLFLDGLRIPCKYVHQLQNLYYALTGEELKLKS